MPYFLKILQMSGTSIIGWVNVISTGFKAMGTILMSPPRDKVTDKLALRSMINNMMI